MKIDDLEAHLLQTPKIANELKNNCNSIKDIVDDIITVIGLPREASNKLKDLSQVLGDVSSALLAARVVKTIQGPADDLRYQADSLKSTVDTYQKKAADIADKIEPLLKTLKDFSSTLLGLITILEGLILTSDTSYKSISAVHQCINSITDDPLRAHGLELLNDFADVCDPFVIELNDNMTKVNNTCDTLKNDLNNLLNQLNIIPKILDEIDDILRPLNKIKDPLNELCKALDKKIGIGRFSFTIRQILNGIKLPRIFRYLEKKFWDLAMNVLNPILDKLHLNITLPSIPDINILDGIDLNVFSELKPLLTMFTDLETLIHNKLSILEQFDVTCPPKANAKKMSDRMVNELTDI